MDKVQKEVTYINRLKVVLAEKHLTNKWLADKLGKDQGTVSKWCTNTLQPNLETLREIALALNVDMADLLWSVKK
ncbi:helix-turn-helix transcriptional regulator [Prevotella brevis]|nr:helix-turn-helix transcriptional regulator [Xylanibacter brevis]MDY4844215.1 helix-turn-helix transcriptional regulator [Prevotella sp.]